MKNALYFILIIITSCSPVLLNVPPDVTYNFTQKFENTILNIDSVIRIDGYFISKHYYNGIQTDCCPIMFFKDGSLIYNFNDYYLTDKKYIRNLPTCGTYTIKDNKITVQYIHHDFYNSSCFEVQYVIRNSETLWLEYSKNLNTNDIVYNNSSKLDFIKSYKFVYLKEKPDSSFWMKEKWWFWADGDKYMEYIQNGNTNEK